MKHSKNKIRLTEDSLKALVKETIIRVMNENVQMSHSGNNLDRYLDDEDFLSLVNDIVSIYGPEDFDGTDSKYIRNMESEIASMVNDFVSDDAVDDFGYKYGYIDFTAVAANLIRYVQSHLDELF